jgi:hypothetical protein
MASTALQPPCSTSAILPFTSFAGGRIMSPYREMFRRSMSLVFTVQTVRVLWKQKLLYMWLYICAVRLVIRQCEEAVPARSIAWCSTGHVDRTCILPEALFEISSPTSSFIKCVHGNLRMLHWVRKCLAPSGKSSKALEWDWNWKRSLKNDIYMLRGKGRICRGKSHTEQKTLRVKESARRSYSEGWISASAVKPYRVCIQLNWNELNHIIVRDLLLYYIFSQNRKTLLTVKMYLQQWLHFGRHVIISSQLWQKPSLSIWNRIGILADV